MAGSTVKRPLNGILRILPIAAFALLAGCLFQDDETFPDLAETQIIGCWVQPNPGSITSCREQCFDPGGFYYGKDVDIVDTSTFLERSGTFDIKDKSIGTYFKFAGSRNPSSIDSGSDRVNYAIKGESLVRLSADGKSLSDVKFIRSDGTHNCGMRWRIFAEPAGWSIP